MSVVAQTGKLGVGKGTVSAVKSYDIAAMREKLVRDDIHGHYVRGREKYLEPTTRFVPVQKKILTWLGNSIHKKIPSLWYRLVLGHDVHLTAYAELHVKHFHASQIDPFTGQLGWLENVGLVSRNKVTTAFRNNIVDNLVADTTAFGDYKFHEVGTDNTAEANSQSALVVSSGIARVTGTQVEAAVDQYQSVATVTADATETWQEHGIFNIVTGGVMMDRSLISPTVSVISGDQVTFTYTLTVTAEA